MASSAQQHPVGLVASHSIDFVRQVLALLDEGRVVVPLRGPDDTQRMSLAGVTEVREPSPEFGWASFSYTPHDSTDTAQFLFTSGTEGLPKGVELPHAALADVVRRLNMVMQVDGSIREYVGIPAYHSFGFGRCRAIAAAGGKAYLPEHGFDPLEVADMLRKGEINAISAVPSLWRVLLENRSMFEDIGEGVRWIEIGSQYMSREEKLAVRELFPSAKIVQHYGLTEASRSTFLEIHATDGPHLESVGKAYGDVEVGLTDDGRIKIRGPHVATRLWVEGEPRSAVDAEGWYETNDLGTLSEGYLYFGGRADDIINCGGLKLAPELLENRVRELQPNLGDFAIARMPDPVRGDGLLISITPADAAERKAIEAAVAEAAAAQGVNARGAIATLTVDALPRTASGKVQRRKLTERWVAEHPTPSPKASAPSPAPALEPREDELRAIWQEALGIDDIGLDESFYDLGGDSLTALNVIMRMGRAGIDPAICRSIFQGATIRDLVAASTPEAAPEPAPEPQASAAPRVDARAAKQAELKAIWQEALGTDDIGLNESFYDLGGDSLTALNVILRMGRAGIDPAICRSIFQGATIDDLVAAVVPEAPAAAPDPAQALRAREAELKAIWQEALGTDDIRTDESFYDLGGDSLTALNVIMRMGRAGIDPAICRSIFQGATIASLAAASLPAPAPAGPDLGAREAELKAIWQEALGTDDIKTTESFYDLGGDSLTALNVIMRMGRAGIDPAICRSIFQGATIRDLAAASLPEPEVAPVPEAPVAAAPDPAPAQKTIGGINASYANNIMVNAVRGILILAVIFGHWSVGVFDRLPESLAILKKAMSPFFLFGTPGFAVTFGIGLGYLQLPVFERNPGRVKTSMRTGLLIVGSGAVLLGLLGAAAQVFMRHEPMNGHTFWVAFFTPLLFYTLAVASIPAWFTLVTKVAKTPTQRIRFLLGLAAMSYAIQMGLDVVLEPVKVRGFLQLVRLMLEAKFAYFDMMSLVFVGLALGTWIKHEGTRDDAPKLMAIAGSAVVGAAIAFGLLTGEIVELTYWPSKNCLTKWVFFAGLVMLVTAWLMRVTRRYSDLAPRIRTLLNGVSTVGQLTLPFYILQSLPIPVKAFLQLLGLPGSVAMLLALAMFFGAAYFMVRRVYAMFHN